MAWNALGRGAVGIGDRGRQHARRHDLSSKNGDKTVDKWLVIYASNCFKWKIFV
jgi:hypothetical protein